MGTVLLPRPANLDHPGKIGRVPRDPIPIGVHDDRASAGLKDPVHVGQSTIRIIDVLQDLSRHGHIEGSIANLQRFGIPVLICEPLTLVPVASECQEVVRYIDAENPALAADDLGHLLTQEAWTAPDVDHGLTGH